MLSIPKLSRSARSDSLFEGLRPSGQNAYSALKTLTEGTSETVEVSGDSAQISLLIPSPTDQTRVWPRLWREDSLLPLVRQIAHEA